MQIIDFSSLEMTIQSIVVGLEWEAPNGSIGSQFGYNITINDFIFDGEIPTYRRFLHYCPKVLTFHKSTDCLGMDWIFISQTCHLFALEEVQKVGGIQTVHWDFHGET